jgi:hypothetical protein
MPIDRRETSTGQLGLEELTGAEETTLSTWLSEDLKEPPKAARKGDPNSEVQHPLYS